MNILRNLALDNSPTDMVFLTDVYCIDWLLIIDYLDWFVDLLIDWLLIGVLAGEHPAEPRPGQLSHRHGVPHRLCTVLIDYWLLIIDRCIGRWTSCGTSPWTTLPPTWCSSQTCTVLIDYWLLIGVLAGEHPAEPRPGQLSYDMVFLTDVYWFIDWLLRCTWTLIDYW